METEFLRPSHNVLFLSLLLLFPPFFLQLPTSSSMGILAKGAFFSFTKKRTFPLERKQEGNE